MAHVLRQSKRWPNAPAGRAKTACAS